MERAVRFVVGFLCHPDGLDDVKVELAEEVLRFLTARSMALNKAVRFRTCQLTVVRHSVTCHEAAKPPLSQTRWALGAWACPGR